MISRREFLVQSVSGMALLHAPDYDKSPSAHQPQADAEKMDPLISAPDNAEDWPAFREKLTAWRTTVRKALGYTGTAYDNNATAWAQRNYVCYFVMMYDRDFYDAGSNSYTVDKIIRRGVDQFGGYDSVVLWQAYPRIGLDERNQFDYFRDMPGGLTGVRDVVAQFHRHNIKVFVPYNPWDTATRREHTSDPEALADLVFQLDADGIFLDTMKSAGPAFKDQLANFHRRGVILESELALDIEEIPQHQASWAQWFNDKYVPGIIRNKWFEARHMQHQIARWNEDHSTELQLAWINGSGMMVWENVFGQWMQWSAQDKHTLKKMTAVQRRYADVFNTGKWTPLIPCLAHGVFASLWEKDGLRIWTLVNRNQRSVSGPLIEAGHVKGDVYYDIPGGTLAEGSGRTVILKGTIAPRSVLCFVAGAKRHFDNVFMQWQAALHGALKQSVDEPEVSVKPIPRQEARMASDFDRSTMVEVQPATILLSTFVWSRECGTYASRMPTAIDLNKPIRYERTARIPHLAVDITPVTNGQFKQFLTDTGYKPHVEHNFLRHWNGGNIPAGKEEHPVVWVDISDARAYCAWAGKRLPAEEEWQFIAEGYEHRVYPWGDEMKTGYCNTKTNDTVPVDAFPAAASPFGCLDMCGNTWELTESESADAHNRFCMLKGGSYYVTEGSIWYTQSGAQPSGNSVKMLLLYPGLDRSATIGFRCVKDLSG